MQIPKGCVAVMVGHDVYESSIVHGARAEEEYGFQHQGPINIPCHVQDFCNVQGLIHQDHHHHRVCCFKD